jgi:hypothetical protein
MKNIKAILWLSIIVLALFATLIWFGIEFKSRGDELTAEKKLTDSLSHTISGYHKKISGLKAKAAIDSANYAKTIQDTQQTCLSIKTDRDYWKDYAHKVESGRWCPEMYGFRKKKKRLVPCATINPVE